MIPQGAVLARSRPRFCVWAATALLLSPLPVSGWAAEPSTDFAGGKPVLNAAAARAPATPAGAPGWPEVHYMLHCQGCHLPDGSGSPGRVPDLRNSVAHYLTVPGGREYLVRIPGISQAPLDDAELAAVLNWVLHRFGPADALRGAVPFTPTEVSRLRRPALTDVTSARNGLRVRLAEP